MKILANLLYKESDGRTSSSKFWFSLTNAAVLYIYVLLGIKLAQAPVPNYEGWALLTFAVAAIVTGNKLANQYLINRSGAGGKNVLDNADK